MRIIEGIRTFQAELGVVTAESALQPSWLADLLDNLGFAHQALSTRFDATIRKAIKPALAAKASELGAEAVIDLRYNILRGGDPVIAVAGRAVVLK